MGVMSNAAPWVDFSVPTACDRGAPALSPSPAVVLTRQSPRPASMCRASSRGGGFPIGRNYSVGPPRCMMQPSRPGLVRARVPSELLSAWCGFGPHISNILTVVLSSASLMPRSITVASAFSDYMSWAVTSHSPFP